MTTALSILAALLAALIIPVLFLAWLTESRTERIQRRARDGWTRKAIAAREGISLYRVRKVLAA
jgi:hypothetical protein